MDKKVPFYKLVSFIASVHRVTHELTKDAKADSITQIQYNMLEYIAVSQPVTPSQISDCINISMSNTSREIRKLNEKKLIIKLTDTKDRRKQYINLSNDGEVMMDESFTTMEGRFLNRIQNASKDDLDDIEHALDILQKKLFY